MSCLARGVLEKSKQHYKEVTARVSRLQARGSAEIHSASSRVHPMHGCIITPNSRAPLHTRHAPGIKWRQGRDPRRP